MFGHDAMLVEAEWPEADQACLVNDEVTIAIQVNGKRRDEITVAKGLSSDKVEETALALDSIKRTLEGKSVRKVIVVPDRIVNVVAG